MHLITMEIRRRLLANGRWPGEDHRPVVRVFPAAGPVTWLITEMDPDRPDLLFGLADPGFGCPELGSVSLRELERVKGLFGLGVERDLHFAARYPLSVYAEAARRAGAIVLAERLLAGAGPAPAGLWLCLWRGGAGSGKRCGPGADPAYRRRASRDDRAHRRGQGHGLHHSRPAALWRAGDRDRPQGRELRRHRPQADDPDPRPLPEADRAQTAIEASAEALAGLFTDTRLEDDLESLLWSFVNIFHRPLAGIERALDDNEQAQRRSQRAQDGSEVKSVELERLIAQGISLIERRNAFEAFRDMAAEHFEAVTGSAWRPRAGSMVNRQALTSAMIDSRDFLAARRRADAQVLLPPGPGIAFTGGIDCSDHAGIWHALDKVRTKHPDMVLLHGGSPKGAERIAACWADTRGVPQIAFKPDWTRHKNAAPFKRNDAMLDALPIGVIAFPGSGISANLADKARRMGIPVWKFGEGGGGA